MISSRALMAMRNPSKICRRSSAFCRSYSLRRRMTSMRCSRKTFNACLSVKTRGSPSTSANKMMLLVTSSGVFLYSSRRIFSSTADLFNSMTIRIPCRSDSSRRSEIPSSAPSRVNSAIRSISEALLVMYGNSLMMMRLLPLPISSRLTRPRNVILPRPVA
ncbi:hypothetical protein SDC9_183864 [bioreactor metagenome]|uniref:Uncharacterized protein n=1 Tax=bioreactor metagenome TaxID=1076179 RepID=A0A645HBF0_9ZZZZ